MKVKPHILLLCIYLTASGGGCKKQDDFLNTKPNQALAVPGSLADLRGLELNEGLFNQYDPALGQMSTDDFYIQESNWNNLSATERNTYIWQKSIYDAGADVSDWSIPYSKIYTANVVLDALPKISYTDKEKTLYNQVKGTALFLRSYSLFCLLQTFCMPYDPASAATDAGIPLRLSSNLNLKLQRSSVKTCYDQLLGDLKTALPLLPAAFTSPTQPSQVSANALLARISLAIADYDAAFAYANASLAAYHKLADYNLLNTPTSTSVSTSFVVEDIYHATLNNYSELAVRRNTVVDSGLYAAYNDNDLRKTKFFAILDNLPQYPRFVGSYDFKGSKFSGLATDELYLIRAECEARRGDTQAAMTDLNTLLVTRWKAGTFVPYSAASPGDALIQILKERRKELLYRGLRWTDLRRLNKEGQFAITLSRTIGGTNYALTPNDPRYALPIPDNEIQLSGITQNPR